MVTFGLVVFYYVTVNSFSFLVLVFTMLSKLAPNGAHLKNLKLDPNENNVTREPLEK